MLKEILENLAEKNIKEGFGSRIKDKKVQEYMGIIEKQLISEYINAFLFINFFINKLEENNFKITKNIHKTKFIIEGTKETKTLSLICEFENNLINFTLNIYTRDDMNKYKLEKTINFTSNDNLEKISKNIEKYI